jgi:hypothetical protein
LLKRVVATAGGNNSEKMEKKQEHTERKLPQIIRGVEERITTDAHSAEARKSLKLQRA